MGDGALEGLTRSIHRGDTIDAAFPTGGRVRCTIGEFKGVTGVMVASRADGRALVRIGAGVYLELPRFCLEALKAAGGAS